MIIFIKTSQFYSFLLYLDRKYRINKKNYLIYLLTMLKYPKIIQKMENK
jgi:hypothetical protein